MEKLLYLIGFLGSVSLTTGITFHLLHMPLGKELFMVGFLALLVFFIPLIVNDRYKIALSKIVSEKRVIIMGVITGIISGLAVLFNVMHLSGGNLLLMLGAVVFAFGFLPFFFFTMYKKSVS